MKIITYSPYLSLCVCKFNLSSHVSVCVGDDDDDGVDAMHLCENGT